MNLSNLQSLAKIGAVTFCGAFFTAMTFTKVPTTLEEAKILILPALTAAIAAEILFLRAQLTALLASLVAAAPTPITGGVTTAGAAVPAAVPAPAPQPAAILAQTAMKLAAVKTVTNEPPKGA
jgi:hypothetical protein